MTYRECFDLFDTDKDNMVSYTEFARGLTSVVPLSQPVVEQIYALMDKASVGLITYQAFLDVLRLGKLEPNSVKDSFDWEAGIINKMRAWMSEKALNYEEAFKLFDQDFDGFVNKHDLSLSLQKHLFVPSEQIIETHLDRLFRLLDFFKTGAIQVSDF